MVQSWRHKLPGTYAIFVFLSLNLRDECSQYVMNKNILTTNSLLYIVTLLYYQTAVSAN